MRLAALSLAVSHGLTLPGGRQNVALHHVQRLDRQTVVGRTRERYHHLVIWNHENELSASASRTERLDSSISNRK
jgi:hypothetical protein